MDKPQNLAAFSEWLSPLDIFLSIGIIIATHFSARLLLWLGEKLAESAGQYRLTVLGSLPLIRLGLWFCAILVIIFGVIRPPYESLVAIGASAALATGLAAQDVIRNAIAGIVLLFLRPYRVGDMVDFGGHYGEITGLNLINTQLRTFEDSVVTIPNSLAFTQAVVNSNSGDLSELVTCEFTRAGTVNVHEVMEEARIAGLCSPYTLLSRPVTVILKDVSDVRPRTQFTIKAYVTDVRLERLWRTDVLARVHAPAEPLAAPDGAVSSA